MMVMDTMKELKNYKHCIKLKGFQLMILDTYMAQVIENKYIIKQIEVAKEDNQWF